MAGGILVVDDDIDIVECVLVEAHARRMHATGTVDATEVRARIGESRPALVLLDLRMPKVDGRDVLAMIKSDPETAGIVVIVMSAMDDPLTVELCLRYGAADFVRKPFALDDLFGRIERALRRPPRLRPT